VANSPLRASTRPASEVDAPVRPGDKQVAQTIADFVDQAITKLAVAHHPMRSPSTTASA
jgi:hypothetical protein